MPKQKTRAGGRSLKFYSTVEFWTSIAGQTKKTVRGESMQTGVLCRCKITKNHVTGKHREVEFPITSSDGVDDLGGCIDYLVKWKQWPKNDKGRISAPEIKFEGNRDKLIDYVEENDLEPVVRELVAGVWAEVEAAVAGNRKKRY